MKKFLHKVVMGAAGAMLAASAAAAPVNGDFQAGQLAPWASFTTANGTLGVPAGQLRQFDVDGDGSATSAFAMSVGYAVAPCDVPGTYCPSPSEGGGIRQTSSYAGGWTTLSAAVAVQFLEIGGFNGQGGDFSLYFDGVLMDRLSFQDVQAGETLRGALSFTRELSAGAHTLEILATRNYAASPLLSQYVDNITAVPAAVPEPMPLALLGLAGLMLAGVRRRRRPCAA